MFFILVFNSQFGPQKFNNNDKIPIIIPIFVNNDWVNTTYFIYYDPVNRLQCDK